MVDLFDNTILCNKCNTKMKPAEFARNGFILRAVVCPECNARIIHPADEAEYHRFVDLKNKDFRVKMRMVGNSYAVSIPKEIVSFIREQEKVMNDMVRLCFEDSGRLSLNFGELDESSANSVNSNSSNQHNSVREQRVVKAREVKVVRNGKVFHAKQFYDSAHPERNQKVYKIGEKEQNQKQ